MRNDRAFSRHGRQAKIDYTYAVPGQWQGRFRRLLTIGDKKGGHSTAALARHPRLLDVLRARVKVPVRFIHVVRNPYDNIATHPADFLEQICEFVGLGTPPTYLTDCAGILRPSRQTRFEAPWTPALRGTLDTRASPAGGRGCFPGSDPSALFLRVNGG